LNTDCKFPNVVRKTIAFGISYDKLRNEIISDVRDPIGTIGMFLHDGNQHYMLTCAHTVIHPDTIKKHGTSNLKSLIYDDDFDVALLPVSEDHDNMSPSVLEPLKFEREYDLEELK
jgi:hypothetical protein